MCGGFVWTVLSAVSLDCTVCSDFDWTEPCVVGLF